MYVYIDKLTSCLDTGKLLGDWQAAWILESLMDTGKFCQIGGSSVQRQVNVTVFISA